MPRREHRQDIVRIRGRRHSIARTLTVGGRSYGVIRRLTEGRERYLVFDATAAPGGDLRALHFYPRSPDTDARLKVLRELGGDARLPMLIHCHHEPARVAVVFDWIDGESLDRWLEPVLAGRRDGPTPYIAVQMLRNLAHALRKVNDRLNVVHGDVKPANLVCPRRNITNLALIDFGSAWCAEQANRQAGLGDGVTWGVYASPEQRHRNQLPDFLSDMFSMGVISYELLTGRTPYDGLGGGAGGSPDCAAAYTGTLTPPSAHRRPSDPTPRELWDKLDRVVCRCLELDARRRYPSWTAVVADLDDAYAWTKRRPAPGSVWNWLTDRLGGSGRARN